MFGPGPTGPYGSYAYDVDQVEKGYHAFQHCTRKHYKKTCILKVFPIWFDKYQSMQFFHLLVCIFITDFHLANCPAHFIWDAMFRVQ